MTLASVHAKECLFSAAASFSDVPKETRHKQFKWRNSRPTLLILYNKNATLAIQLDGFNWT